MLEFGNIYINFGGTYLTSKVYVRFRKGHNKGQGPNL